MYVCTTCMYVHHGCGCGLDFSLRMLACKAITDVGAVLISQCACLRCKARPRTTSGVQSRSYSLVHPSPVHAPRLTESTLIFKKKDACKLCVRMLDSVAMLNQWTKEKFGSIICVRALNEKEMLNQQTSEICSS